MSTALIAEDEPLLREALVRQLAQAWPELRVVALARNGHEALNLFDQHQPAICFLDVHMPGLSGLQVAQTIGRRAHLVFVTAYDQYAVGAFAAAAVDYLLKPVRADRLAETVLRLQERLRNAAPASGTETLLQQLIDRMTAPIPTVRAPLRWLQAQSGPTLRLIAVEDVDYLQADLKYTRVAWRDPGGQPLQALIRTPLKTLLEQLDGSQFKQVHRSTVVNLRAILHIHRPDPETAVIHLRNRPETLRISRSHLDQFRQM